MLRKHLPLMVMFAFIAGIYQLFIWRFTITFPAPNYRCLIARVFIVDKWDKDFKRGDLVAFHFDKKDDMLFKTSMKFIKKVVAIEGDSVEVKPSRTYINDEEIELSMIPSAMALNVIASDYSRKITIPKNEFFAMGETLNSYDSRYWGNVKTNEVIGKAYAIF